MPRIRSVATALPAHCVDQATAREGCRKVLGDHRLLEVFDHTGVETRYLAFPPEYYMNGHTFAERNRDYVAQALVLGERAVRAALDRAGLRPADIDHFYFVTTTGLATPSVDALLTMKLGMRPNVVRNPLFGIGCAGGAAMIGRAGDLLRGRPKERALLLSVELCGQTFRKGDRSPVNYVGVALFGDGAAAAVVEGDDVAKAGPEIVASGTELFPATEHVMGWDFEDDGMRLVLSAEVPVVIETRVLPAVERFLAARGLSRRDVRRFILHPGGRRVLESYASTLGLSDDELRPTRESLRRFGNLSSAAVLFVLADVAGDPGEYGLLAAVGPGFAVEQVLLRW